MALGVSWMPLQSPAAGVPELDVNVTCDAEVPWTLTPPSAPAPMSSARPELNWTVTPALMVSIGAGAALAPITTSHVTT